MKRLATKVALMGALLVLTAAMALAADKFEDKAVGVAVELPDGFAIQDQRPPLPPELGTVKGFYLSKSKPESGGMLLVHQMDLPCGLDLNGLKTRLPDAISEHLGAGYKLLTQLDVTSGAHKGFLLEFEAPGDGKFPQPNGTQKEHVRWYLLQEGNKPLVGLLYHSTEDTWKEMLPKFEASFKTLKKVE